MKRVPDTWLIWLFFLSLGLNTPYALAKTVPENNFFRSIRANQKESYITFSQGMGNLEPLIFEGLVAPYFLLRTNRDSRWGATLSPAIMIRMQATESFPVRTPSYMPQLSFYHQLTRFLDPDEPVRYLFLTLAHHSNGQEEPFYLEDGRINTRSGDFSTNYFEIGAFFNERIIPFSHTTEYFKTSLEVHVNLDRSRELEGQYSFLRWNNSFRINKFSFKRLRSLFNGRIHTFDDIPIVQTLINTSWMFGDMNDTGFWDITERLNVEAVISYRPKILKDVSLFLRYYHGQDYYNMFFYRRIHTLQFGLQAYSF